MSPQGTTCRQLQHSDDTWGGQTRKAAGQARSISAYDSSVACAYSTLSYLVPMAEPNLKPAQAEHLHAP